MSEFQTGVITRAKRPTRQIRSTDVEDLQKKLAKQRDRDNEMVNGIFKNYENPGGTLIFGYRIYKDQDVETYELTDGERYRLPRGIVKHLLNDCYYKEYVPLKDVAGRCSVTEHGTPIHAAFNDGRIKNPQTLQASKKVHRFGFQPLDFMYEDIDVKPVDIIEVTYAGA